MNSFYISGNWLFFFFLIRDNSATAQRCLAIFSVQCINPMRNIPELNFVLSHVTFHPFGVAVLWLWWRFNLNLSWFMLSFALKLFLHSTVIQCKKDNASHLSKICQNKYVIGTHTCKIMFTEWKHNEIMFTSICIIFCVFFIYFLGLYLTLNWIKLSKTVTGIMNHYQDWRLTPLPTWWPLKLYFTLQQMLVSVANLGFRWDL